MDAIRCQRCGCEVEKIYLFWCPTYGQFHNDGGTGYCCKFRTRCDGLNQICCPVCGFMPCRWCHGTGNSKIEIDSQEEICPFCKGTGKEPFRLRKIPREEPRNFKKEMLLNAKELALRADIRYLYLRVGKGDYISFSDVRNSGWSDSLPLTKKRKRHFYGWLCLFTKGKHRRFKYRWQDLIS